MDNRIEGVVITFSDVTQLKRASEQSQLLATVLMDSNDAITVHDFDGRIKVWNRGAERMFGYSEREALRMNAEQTVPQETRAEMRSIWNKLEQGERVGSYETRRLTKAGQVIDVWVTATLMTDEAGRPLAIAKTERDVTDRKRVQADLEQEVARRTAALLEQQERLRAILNAPDDAIISIHHNGDIESVNSAAERIFGYTAAEMVGQNVKMLMPPPYHDEHDRYLDRFLTTGERRIIGIGREVTARRKNGSHFPVDLSISEVEHFKLFTAILRDISVRKNLQQEVLEIAAQEQSRIGADLHDHVGQELTALGLLADTLVASVQDHSPASEMAQKVNQGLKSVLRQVQSISRGLVPVDVDAQGLPNALAELATHTSENSGVACSFHCKTPIDSDDNLNAQHLFLIAREACMNSAKHSQAKHIVIRLETTNGVLVLQVEDDGIGLPDDHHDGVGLRIMNNRARLIGADLKLEPVKPHGTMVTCTLIEEQSDVR
jgi:PAS domain S-box-containing protein